MTVSRKSVVEVAITGLGDTVFLRLSAEGFELRQLGDGFHLEGSPELADALAKEFAKYADDTLGAR